LCFVNIKTWILSIRRLVSLDLVQTNHLEALLTYIVVDSMDQRFMSMLSLDLNVSPPGRTDNGSSKYHSPFCSRGMQFIHLSVAMTARTLKSDVKNCPRQNIRNVWRKRVGRY
jgi:hypothetical protein